MAVRKLAYSIKAWEREKESLLLNGWQPYLNNTSIEDRIKRPDYSVEKIIINYQGLSFSKVFKAEHKFLMNEYENCKRMIYEGALYGIISSKLQEKAGTEHTAKQLERGGNDDWVLLYLLITERFEEFERMVKESSKFHILYYHEKDRIEELEKLFVGESRRALAIAIMNRDEDALSEAVKSCLKIDRRSPSLNLIRLDVYVIGMVKLAKLVGMKADIDYAEVPKELTAIDPIDLSGVDPLIPDHVKVILDS